MELLVQSFKDIFLWITTFTYIFYCFRNPYRSFCFYLGFLIFCAFLGFQRPIYWEVYIVPITLFLSLLNKKNIVINKEYKHILFLLIYVFLISLINNRNPWPIQNYTIYGLILIILLPYISKAERNQYIFLGLIWGYCISYMIWYIMHSGENLFTIASVDERMILVESDLVNNQEGNRGGIDPNYFGFITGVGALLSTFFYVYFNEFASFFNLKYRKGFIKYSLLIFALFQFFLSVKGLSRGVFIADFFSISLFVLLLNSRKKFAKLIFALAVMIFIIDSSGIFDKLLFRFNDSGSASRSELFVNVIGSVLNYNGYEALIFGGGTGFPWNQYSNDLYVRSFSSYSTHNSWLRLLIDYGLIWMLLFFLCIYKFLKRHLNDRMNFISVIKLVLFAFVFVIGLSIEPLKFQIGWLILVLFFI